jgi:hypothetical protein
MKSAAAERERVIEQWILRVIADGEMDRYDDLHLDQIDPAWKPKETWVNAALEAHRTAVELRTAHMLDVVVVLAFSLNDRAAYPLNGRRALEAALDWSPPSLYLFRRGAEPWREPGFVRTEQLNPAVFGCGEGIAAFDVVFRQRDTEELHRSIYVAA